MTNTSSASREQPATREPSERLAQIEARLNAATPAPWTRVLDSASENTIRAHSGGALAGVIASLRLNWIHDAQQSEQRVNADLIANAPADLAYLLGEVRSLRAAVPLDAGPAREPTPNIGRLLDNYDAACQASLDAVREHGPDSLEYRDAEQSVGRARRAITSLAVSLPESASPTDLERRYDAAMNALTEFGKHWVSCNVNRFVGVNYPVGLCNCGFDEAKKRATEGRAVPGERTTTP